MSSENTNALPLVRGKLQQAQRVVLYGPEGIGKSTLASAFPNPVFLDTEGGTAHLDVTRFPKPECWNDVLRFVEQLTNAPGEFKTLVVDTIDWLERLLAEHLCRKANKEGIEDFGYGKGYSYLAEELSRFLRSLERLRKRGVHLVLVAHSTIRKFEQPDAAGAYDRYELKLTKQCAPLVKEWCDLLLFVNYLTKVTERDGKKHAVGGKERRVYTSHTASYDAKNRHGLPEHLPMEFSALAPLFGDVAPAPAKEAKQSAPIAEPEFAGPIMEQQVKNLESLWKQLGYGQAEMSKLFQWLEAEALDGAETWQDLNQKQAARAIAFLCKKTGKEVAE